MTEFSFLEAAQIEFEEAVNYYNAQRPGLGDDFAKEVAVTISRILRFPEAWSKLSRRTRRCRTNRFPYAVVYQIRRESLLIVAVAHLKRKPYYWRHRLGST